MEAVILFSILIITIALSIPIGITLGLATGIAMWLTSDIPMIMLAQKSVTGLDSFPLLAIPFFILAGALMCNGGISRRLVALAESLVGYIVGGLAMVTVLACMFFAAISGSGPATVSAIGSFMIPSMKERKYDAGFAAAITAAAGTIGVIIPPSIPFVIYCVVAQCSIGDMFIAGIIPGIIIGIALMLVCYITARKRNYKTMTDRPRFSEVAKAFKESFWALLVPLIILGGIYGGIFTPTEAAVVAVVYSVVIGKFVYRELDMKVLYDCLKSTGLINGATSFLIGLSMAFASYLAMAQIPAKIAAWLTTFVDSPFLLLMIINVFLLVIGCFVDNIAAVIILTPILLPVVKMIGIDPIHFGLIITVNLACGFISPPYGINLFVASAISGESIESISREIIPAFVAMVGCLLLFTYFPIFSMGLLQMMR
ncbi:MAG: TRAP transporter large permease [Synergistaceae bacterium]|jgi:C4-dicarboxylate transporter DctM subunit|nr:TRAP transporter large permease [Synergistaceae bacterium]MCE5183246.1 TRAP transporter large permease [Synergistaceae bacterium]MDD2351923.1 TRAP transporter large permease [Synergistaceae bacterium]MDD4750851.1 TRAP transporter large permease [Synergistaceae bacterium]PKL03826.1 MAG: C4-dicarboxylate ABC transporter permease [Synergistetes bacterium HGW-Synergistetes-1]